MHNSLKSIQESPPPPELTCAQVLAHACKQLTSEISQVSLYHDSQFFSWQAAGQTYLRKTRHGLMGGVGGVVVSH